MAKNSREQLVKLKIQLYAYAFVNLTGGNAPTAYKWVLEQLNIEKMPKHLTQAAWHFTSRYQEEIEEEINKLQEENRKNYDKVRDQNIAILCGIRANGSTGERITAIKELNNMFGLNEKNINLKADALIEVDII